ncbi:MAG: SIR2 family protein [Myxococcales bacterium]|nr:SIR2 family protein [Myxococcales bacterium]
MGFVHVTLGDVTQLRADAIAYSTDRSLSRGGQLTAAFERRVEGFAAAYGALRARVWPAKPPPGTSFFLPLEGRPCGVVVTVATGDASPRAERAYAAVEGALRCAAEHLEAAGIPRPWRIALPTFLTGDGGARHDRLAVAEPQIEAAHDFLEREPDSDVAFVPYTEGTYQVWLEARRRVEARRGIALDPTIEPEPALVNAVRRGECVLFVGSGTSLGSGLPTWSGLVGELETALEIPMEHRHRDLDHFLDLAQWYRDEGRSPSLEDLLRARFSVSASGARPTLTHYLLTALPIRHFVTTNYDDLLETALEALRVHPIRVVREEDVARTGARDGRFVVKFHGCAATPGSEFVLSRDDYDDFFRTRPAMALLLEGLLLNQTFFFVGYGLRDPDFRQIHHRIAHMLQGAKRPAFATTFDRVTPQARTQWQKKQLSLVSIPGADDLAKARHLDRYLDRLGERVAQDPQLFLAEDVERPDPDPLARLRATLLEVAQVTIGTVREVETLSASDARTLADVLRFLTRRGFRGHSPHQLAQLFTELARHPGLSEQERLALLVSALRHTEGLHQAEALRTLIARR